MRMKNNPEKFRNARARSGLTQSQVARKSGVSERTIKNIEQGKTTSSHTETLRLIAHTLSLDWNDLHDGPAEETKPQRTRNTTSSCLPEREDRANGVAPPTPPVFIVIIVHESAEASGNDE